MIKQGLLDKHGKPNESTPANYLSEGMGKMDLSSPKKVKKEVADDSYVIPSEGNEPAPTKRKVSLPT
jgi:hypothetical protein